MSEVQTSKGAAVGTFAWLRALLPSRQLPAELSRRTRKLPPIADVLSRAGREPLPPD